MKQGAKFFRKLGMIRANGSQPNPEALSVGPSGLDLEGNQVNAPMTEEEIREVIQAYADAALHARETGFDGIKLHGAHGFLIDQFFGKRQISGQTATAAIC